MLEMSIAQTKEGKEDFCKNVEKSRNKGFFVCLNLKRAGFFSQLFNRNELSTTLMLENAIAAAAKIGLSKIPKNG